MKVLPEAICLQSLEYATHYTPEYPVRINKHFPLISFQMRTVLSQLPKLFLKIGFIY